jgi:hypothetical protein
MIDLWQGDIPALVLILNQVPSTRADVADREISSGEINTKSEMRLVCFWHLADVSVHRQYVGF